MQTWAAPAAASMLAAQRRLCSTPSDDFNREMAEFFGVPDQPPQQPPQQQRAAPSSGARSPSSAAGPSASEGMQQGGELLPEVHEFNSELLGVLGPPPSGDPDAPQAGAAGAAPAASPLAQQLAAAAGSRLRASPRQYAAESGAAGELDATAWAAGGHGGSSFAAAGSGSGGSGAELTHVDASGKAAMVDVSQVSAPCRRLPLHARPP